MSVNTMENIVVLEDFSSYQAESVIHVAGAGKLLAPPISLDVFVKKMERSEEEARAARTAISEQVRNDTVCIAANFIV